MAVTVIDRVEVDGEQWYTVHIPDTGKWLRQNYPELEDRLWFDYTDNRWNIFDVHEKIYLILELQE